MDWKYWLAGAVGCLILEILPPPTHFFFICLALGALAAAITSVFSSTPWLPWVVFALTSVALTPLLVPLAKFLFSQRPTLSNVDALPGARALVLERVDERNAGLVKVAGEEWRARSEDVIEKEEWAEVVRVEGTHLIIRRLR